MKIAQRFIAGETSRQFSKSRRDDCCSVPPGLESATCLVESDESLSLLANAPSGAEKSHTLGLAQLAEQPRLRQRPLAFDGRWRNTNRIRGLFDG